MPSAIEVNFFIFFNFQKIPISSKTLDLLKDFTQKFQVQLGFENVGQNTLRIIVPMFPNPKE